jgi:hypothetical protein
LFIQAPFLSNNRHHDQGATMPSTFLQADGKTQCRHMEQWFAFAAIHSKSAAFLVKRFVGAFIIPVALCSSP